MLNTLRQRQNGCHLADTTFKCIFLNENFSIFIKISLTVVSKGPINNIPALIQIMAWRRQVASYYLIQWRLGCQRIYTSLSLNELKWACQRTADWTEQQQQQQHWSWSIVFFLFCDEIHGPFLPVHSLQVHLLMTSHVGDLFPCRHGVQPLPDGRLQLSRDN